MIVEFLKKVFNNIIKFLLKVFERFNFSKVFIYLKTFKWLNLNFFIFLLGLVSIFFICSVLYRSNLSGAIKIFVGLEKEVNISGYFLLLFIFIFFMFNFLFLFLIRSSNRRFYFVFKNLFLGFFYNFLFFIKKILFLIFSISSFLNMFFFVFTYFISDFKISFKNPVKIILFHHYCILLGVFLLTTFLLLLLFSTYLYFIGEASQHSGVKEDLPIKEDSYWLNFFIYEVIYKISKGFLYLGIFFLLLIFIFPILSFGFIDIQSTFDLVFSFNYIKEEGPVWIVKIIKLNINICFILFITGLGLKSFIRNINSCCNMESSKEGKEVKLERKKLLIFALILFIYCVFVSISLSIIWFLFRF